ncbi:hypothetical protein HYPSUDRAFT_631436 [Hypholoma sublateritium FD-334 SS-4]|uniref:Uncharacterized protein n=1 Tax=Hypholoma sublateritium (strain FD-334 SS-4) TaxID=945553 RepID=A0A0D2PDQ7_HYPSF|nr:hypothetical protein HYPSUDRAFT_631436 [Hypholoma sublateritium FD-334 SS-4]
MPSRKLVTKSCPRLHAHHLMSCYDRLYRAAIASTDCDVASRPLPDLTLATQACCATAFYPATTACRPLHIPPSLLYDRVGRIALATTETQAYYCYHTAESRRFVTLTLPPSVVVRTALARSAARATLAVLSPDLFFTLRPRSFHARQLLFITLCTLWKTHSPSFSGPSPCSRANTSQTLISYSCTPTRRSQSGGEAFSRLIVYFSALPLPGLRFILRSLSTCVRPAHPIASISFACLSFSHVLISFFG